MKNAATIADVAKALGCNNKAAASRLVALGYVETCRRCGGSGRYSFNMMDGDRCYGCNGRGKHLARVTARIVAEAKARQDAGELSDYFAKNAARAAAKRQIAPLVAEAEAVYKTISNAYTRASRVGGWARVCDSISRAQGLNNRLYWGPDKAGKSGADLFGSDSVQDVEYRVQRGEEDAVRAVAILRERIADLTALRDAAAPHLETWIEETKAAAAMSEAA